MGIFSNISSSWNKVKKMSKTMKQNAKKVGSETSTGMKGLSDKLKSKVDDAGKKAAAKTKAESFMSGGSRGVSKRKGSRKKRRSRRKGTKKRRR